MTTAVIGFSNRGRSTLNMPSGLSSVGTTIIIQTADVSLFPASGQFDVAIESEFVTVPAASNTGGPTYAGVTRGAYGTTPVAHANTTPVTEVLTENDLEQFNQHAQENIGTDFAPTGLTGAIAASRYGGRHDGGHPTAGTWNQGDWVIDATTPAEWLCTVAGTPGTWVQLGGGSGSVTSVAMTGDGTVFNASVPGSPITGTGTLAPTLKTQNPNTVFAGPVAGAAAAPTARALTQNDLTTLQHYLAAYNYMRGASFTNYRIGLADSLDRRTFIRRAEPGVDLGTAGAWDDTHVKDPCIIRDATDVLYLYYSGQHSGVWGIGVAQSFDGGLTWTKYASNPVLTATAAWETSGASAVQFPAVLYDTVETDATKRFKMWYGAGNNGLGIGYASSPDGLTWTKYSGNPVLGLGAGGSWESTNVYPNAVVRRGNTFYLFYGGNDGTGSGHWQSGLVTFTDPQGTYTRSPGNPLLKSDGITTTLTANLTSGSTTATVANAAIFPIGAPVWCYDTAGHEFLTTVAKRLSTTSLQLADVAPVTILSASGGIVRSAANNSLFIRAAAYDGGWQFGVSAFQINSPTALWEQAMLAYAMDDLATITLDYAAGLLVPLALSETQTLTVSTENPSIIDLHPSSRRYEATKGGGSSSLPVATASVLGGVKVGSGLAVTIDGTISSTVSGVGELLVTDGTTNPPVAMWTEDGTDFLYTG